MSDTVITIEGNMTHRFVRALGPLALAAIVCAPSAFGRAAGGFSIVQLLSYPYPSSLVASADGGTIAWVLNQRGIRNIFVAAAPGYEPRMITTYNADDGQELSNVSISNDGKYVVYVRGGDHDSNWPAPQPPNPALSTTAPDMQVWSVATAGGAPIALGPGDTPVISPDNRRVAISAADGSVMVASLDGTQKAAKMFADIGQDSDFHWSPDGHALAFVSTRSDHAFIGVYRDNVNQLLFLAPSTLQDAEPRWSPDGSRIAFLRVALSGGPPQNLLVWNPIPFSIVVADARDGRGTRVWKSPTTTMRGSFPQSFDPNLQWIAGNRLAFLNDADNWPHVYAVPASGGAARLLTPGNFWIEDVALSPDRQTLYYTANTGNLPDDIDRRHIFALDLNSGARREVTSGERSQWTPAVADAGRMVAFIEAGAKEPPLVTIGAASGGPWRALGRERIPADFPAAQFVTPKSVTFRASDGLLVHGQLFERPGEAGRMPGIIFVHGGPPRQMLVTWHYMDYYSNAYAVNQYLANHGFVVLSVNYRLGIGYGNDFNFPAHWGPTGASEYKDVLAGARFLQADPQVNARRIGIWGGSYGGYLTALALARNSDIFGAGVDWHGVHDWTMTGDSAFGAAEKRYEQPNLAKAQRIAWESSPASSVAKWTSPVLLIQGDDDHNVHFHQMVDLVRRLQIRGTPFCQIVIPNEIHGFLRYHTFVQVDSATVAYFEQKLRGAGSGPQAQCE